MKFLDKKQFDELTSKMDQIIVLLAQNLVKDCKTQKEKIIVLYSMGYKPLAIAEMLGTTRNTVSVTVNEAKKEGNL